MPDLLDLPPELISHIFFLCEDLIYQESEDAAAESVVFALPFRLTNRYIEKCTRRVFATSYFHTQSIEMSEDASFKRFCDIARFPELARYVYELRFYAVNDRHERRKISSISRNEFVDALRACSDVGELEFYDAPSDQADELQRAERTENDPDVPTIHEVFDMSATFSFALSAAEEAGLRLNTIWTSSCDLKKKPLCGLSDCSAIAERTRVMREVEQLDIKIVPQRPEQGAAPEHMYARSRCIAGCES